MTTLLEQKLRDGLSRLRELYPPTEFIRCRICGKRFKSLGGNHTKWKHNMTAAEYKDTYNIHTMLSDAVRRKGKSRVLNRAEQIWLRKYWSKNRITGPEVVRMLGLSSVEHFNSWRKKLKLAPVPNYHKRWSPDLIIEALRQRQRQGKPLTSSRVKADNPRLLWAAERHLGSWRNALKQSGIPVIYK